jgi:hypothetical protein
MKLAIPAAGLILMAGAGLLPFAVHAQDVPPQSASATAPATSQAVDPNRDQSSRVKASVSLFSGGGGGSTNDPVAAVMPRTGNAAIRGSTDGDVTK